MKTILIACFAVVALTGAVRAADYQQLYSFCKDADCSDGADPWSAPVGDGAGNYYGAAAGRDKNEGTIYRLSFDGTNWTYTTLYAFCVVDHHCPDGKTPHGQLVLDTQGNLYGTTEVGGDNNRGVVFELSPKHGGWKYTRLYSFCALSKCADGENLTMVTLSYQGAQSGALYDGTAPLFGATTGDLTKTHGTVFSLTPARRGWKLKTLYTFCSETNCADGDAPYSGPIVDAAGNLFGVTVRGGAVNQGAFYELVRNGNSYDHQLVYDFCQQASCGDGSGPMSAPVMDGNGALYGTASAGGVGAGSHGQGTVYKLELKSGVWKFTKLHDFCNKSACSDGALPWGGVTLDTKGNIVGSTFLGGDANAGVLYKLAGRKQNTFSRLVSLGGASTPGGLPMSAPILVSPGTFIGTTANGGGADQGVIYQLKP